MASVNIKKCKGGETKAIFLHNDKFEREREGRTHSNETLNKTLSKNNVQLLDYRKACERYDYLIAASDAVANANKRKDRVKALMFEAPIPEFIPNGERDYRDFANALQNAVEVASGLNNKSRVLNVWIHVDEQHEYIDADTGVKKESLNHVHYAWCPTDENGRLNCNKIYNRSFPNKINQAMDDYCMERYGQPYRTGAKKKGKSVEQLKRESKNTEQVKDLNKEIQTKMNLKESLEKQTLALENERQRIEEANDQLKSEIEQNEKIIENQKKSLSTSFAKKYVELACLFAINKTARKTGVKIGAEEKNKMIGESIDTMNNRRTGDMIKELQDKSSCDNQESVEVESQLEV